MEGKEAMDIRLNIFDENGKWIGQEYLTDKGKWVHRWTLKGELEKGSWRGRAKGDNDISWRYELVMEANIIQPSTQFICHSCATKHSGKTDDQLHEVCEECFIRIDR